MSTPADPDTALQDLAALLRRRLEVIADHAWRDRDPDAHLEALKSVSLEISTAHQSLSGQLPVPPQPFLRAL